MLLRILVVSMKKSITLDEDVWAELLKLKADMRERSLSNVIRRLIENWRSKHG